MKAQITVGLTLLVAVCGCSTFNRDWKGAAHEPQSQNSAEGRWDGKWISESNGHHGALRCLMSREDDSHYQARFHATWGGVFHFNYTARFEMQPHDIGWEFNGEADLGKLGGVYYYEGRATTTNMVSTYQSKYDHGTFDLKRPKPR